VNPFQFSLRPELVDGTARPVSPNRGEVRVEVTLYRPEVRSQHALRVRRSDVRTGCGRLAVPEKDDEGDSAVSRANARE